MACVDDVRFDGLFGRGSKNISLAFKCSYRRSLAARFLQFDLLTLSPAMATGATEPLSMPRASARSSTKYVARWLRPKTARDACMPRCACRKSDSAILVMKAAEDRL